MTDIGIATGAEQPINRDGRVPAEELEQGDLVGIDANGELALADAQAEANGGAEINAVGIAFADVVDESKYYDETVRQAVHSEKVTLQNGNRIAYVRYGVILENADEDWGFAPGEPVYLDVGGGFTQTAPSTAGDIVQVVGYATDDGEAVFLDVDAGYDNA